MMKVNKIKSVFEAYRPVEADFEVEQLQSGHINQTFLVHNGAERFVLQNINTAVFEHLDDIMHNMKMVAAHLTAKNYPQHILKPLMFQDDNLLFAESWRLASFFEDTQTFEKVQSSKQAYEAAKFLSEFHYYLSDIDKTEIKNPIPGFTDFNQRYDAFEESKHTADKERLDNAVAAIAYVESQKDILKEWEALLPKLPERLIHADPKISNFLFNAESSQQIEAIIDWDTLMCGTILYDFGDMVRSYTNLRAEDDPEEGHNFSQSHYDALKDGFLYHLKDDLTTEEVEHLALAAKVVIYVQAIRFLTDYLNGDTYFAIHRPEQNLDRTKNQLNLLKALVATLN